MTDHRSPSLVFESYVRFINAGDLDAVMDLFDESVTTSDAVARMFKGSTPKATLRRYIGETVIAKNGRLEALRISVSADGWAYGELILRSDMVREHGQTRIVGIDKIQVQDGKITHFAFLPDVLDRETRAYYTSLGLFGTKLPPRTDQR